MAIATGNKSFEDFLELKCLTKKVNKSKAIVVFLNNDNKANDNIHLSNNTELLCYSIPFDQRQNDYNPLYEGVYLNCSRSYIKSNYEIKQKFFYINTSNTSDLSIYAKEKLKEISVFEFIKTFENELLPILEAGKEMAAMNCLFKHFQDSLLEEKINLIDKVLEQLDYNKYPLKFLVGILSATNPWKNELLNRNNFVKIVEDKIITELGQQRVNAILGGLK